MTARLRILLCGLVLVAAFTNPGVAQTKKVRIAIPGYTIAMVSLLAAKMNGYYTAEGLEVELVAMQAPTANLALVSKLAGAKEVAAMERPFDFSVIRKAHATLRSKGWQP